MAIQNNQYLLNYFNNSKFNEKSITPEANKVLGFDSSFNPVMKQANNVIFIAQQSQVSSATYYSQLQQSLSANQRFNFKIDLILVSNFTPIFLINTSASFSYKTRITRSTGITFTNYPFSTGVKQITINTLLDFVTIDIAGNCNSSAGNMQFGVNNTGFENLKFEGILF